MTSLYFPICAALISVLIAIIFFNKKKTKNNETIIYSYLIIISLVEAILACVIIYIAKAYGTTSILYLLYRLDYTFILLWVWLMFLYVHVVSNNKARLNLLVKVTLTLNIVVLIAITFTNMNIINIGQIINTRGTSTNILYFTCAFYIMLISISIIKSLIGNRGNIKNAKYVPLYTLTLLGIVTLIMRQINPNLVLEPFIIAYINLIMYHTIENPDLKTIEALNIARVKAEKANQAKTEFLSRMSHEIRTPINTIKGFSQSILEGSDINAIKDEAKDIVRASDSLIELVNGILDISKIEENKIEIKNVYYKPSELLDEVITIIKGKIGEKKIELSLNIGKKLPNILCGDAQRIKEILVNLLTNAVKYTKQGFVQLSVEAVTNGETCNLIMCIEDSGIGIKPDDMKKLFKKTDGSDNETTEGSGLGLVITKQLVEMMNGKINATSTYGKGSKFIVSIDQRTVDEYVTDDESAININKDKILDFSNKKILVVDDNQMNLKVVSALLKKYNIQIVEASDGNTCINKIGSGEKVDLILMDDMMPNLDGKETFAKLKEIKGFNTPVVMLTANAIVGMKESYLYMGFADYIAKPIDKGELESILHKFLD